MNFLQKQLWLRKLIEAGAPVSEVWESYWNYFSGQAAGEYNNVANKPEDWMIPLIKN